MQIKESITIMKSLADSSRLLILNSLMEKAQYVEELSERHKLAASTVSFHLKKLEQAGLVSKKKEQYYIVYTCNEEVLNLSLREITSFTNVGKFIQDERIEKYKEKVLKTFFKKNTLLKLPAQHKKKLIVLDVFANMFKKDKSYTENEVDSIINKAYDDHCTIRRLLIEEKRMTRKNQIYKRIE